MSAQDDMMDYLADDEEPMLAKGTGPPSPQDYVEKRKFCWIFSPKCAYVTVGILMIIDFMFQLIAKLFYISQNEFFDPIYFQVYAGLLTLYAVGLCLYLVYLLAPDSPTTRGLIPWALIIAAIANVLIIFWIVIYINSIYSRDDVKIIT